MSNRRNDSDFLADIEEAAEKIARYVNMMSFESFCDDSKTIDAVIRNLEIIGEAAKSVSDPLKLINPDVAWKGMAGLRDRLIHNYFGVDVEIVWNIVTNEIPLLIRQLRGIEL